MSVEIETGICGDDQESSFMNATLQGAGETERAGTSELEFSVAVHVEVPEGVAREQEHVLQHYLDAIFSRCVEVCPGLSIHVQLGRAGNGLRKYRAVIGVGPGTGNTYETTFDAEDEEHAREQAVDHVLDSHVEHVISIEEVYA